MGIYDREYYRNDGPSFLGSIAGRSRVLVWLIGINVVCYIIQLATDPRNPFSYGWFTDALWMDEARIKQGEIWRLLTAAFLHDPRDPLHLIWNMIFLFWFGRDVEDIYGPREFLAFYLVSAVLSIFAMFAWHFTDPIVAHGFGASGAVTAVMVMRACHYPYKTILMFMFLPVPIWLFVLLNVFQDVYGLLGFGKGNIGFSAHLAGAAFAGLYYWRSWRMTNLVPDIRSWLRERSQPKLRIYHEGAEQPAARPVAVGKPENPEVDEQLEAKLDAVLEKVHRSGKGSLTASEQEFLNRASEAYKRRRS